MNYQMKKVSLLSSEELKQKVDEFHEDLAWLFDIASSTILALENAFYEDQTTTRQKCIGTVGQVETQRIKKTIAMESNWRTLHTKFHSTRNKTVTPRNSMLTPKRLPTKLLDWAALETSRWNVSDRAAAAILSATLSDIRMLSPEEVADESKIHRAKKKSAIQVWMYPVI